MVQQQSSLSMAGTALGALTRPIMRPMRAGLIAATALGALASAASADAQTIRAVMHSGLRVLDPIITTAYITRDHGYMIYDTLFALDENFNVKPQMAEDWSKSEDGLTWTITLRDGLKFHDGAPVTAEDAIASIKRWGQRDSMGQKLMDFIDEMSAPDDKTIEISLKEPYGLVLNSLAKPSSNVPFIMPKRLAETPSTEPVPEQIGSGPFRWVGDEYQPGVRAVYEKFEEYVPREEEPSWASGGKDVKIDRVEWVVVADDQTSLNALLSGEIDFWESPPSDLLPILENNEDITVKNLNELGFQTISRMNFLYPPFDDKKVRQAAMMAMSQQDTLDALVGNPDLYQLCGAMFVCGTPLETDVGSEAVVEGTGMEQAKKLLEESSYDGAPVVVMHPTDVSTLRSQPVVGAQALRDAGFTVDLQAMDWQTLVGRRASQAPIGEGGWNMFFTNWVGADVFNPLVNNMVNGGGKEASWFGWPDLPEADKLRDEYARAETPEQQQQIAEKLQKLAYDEVMYVPLGQYIVPDAWSTRLDGVLEGPAPYFWNISKSE